MVSACVLYLDDVELTEQKAFVPDSLSALFQESDRARSEDADGEVVIQYRTARASMLRRLDLMGCTAALAERAFDRWREGAIRNEEEFRVDFNDGDDASLVALRALSWAEWRRRVPGVLRRLYESGEDYEDETDRRMREIGESSWLWFDGWDSLISLRGVLEGADGWETVVLDVSPLVNAGWIEADDPVCARTTRIVAARGQPPGPVIVLAEGASDIEVLRAGLPVFHPDLAEFVTFLDHSEFKVDGGAGYVVKFLKAFAAARVPANVVAVLDNDAAGINALRQALSLDLPDNMSCIRLPDIELAREYPTVGPQGGHRNDINGLACGIELYLGEAALSADGALRPVRWTGKVGDAWQGDVENKKAVRDRFLAEVQRGDVVAEREFPEMALVWRSILDAATKNAEAAQAQARPPPEW